MLITSGEIWCPDEKAFCIMLKKSFSEAFDMAKSGLFFLEIQRTFAGNDLPPQVLALKHRVWWIEKRKEHFWWFLKIFSGLFFQVN